MFAPKGLEFEVVHQSNGIRILGRAQFYNLSVLLRSLLGECGRVCAWLHKLHRVTPIRNVHSGSSVATGLQPNYALMQMGQHFSEWANPNPEIS